ncbi:MAG: N-acetyl-gamma-glutamyl-phosphate reductase [Bacteroidaceae bacterium]|nr:N-acetyl-gamma-glutamyl-phosphate reductase [Bacteroidaceae bacterium]
MGGVRGRLRIGIFGAAGYTGGELIRLLLNHPEAEIVFAHSESNAGNLVSDVHEGLVGECDLRFSRDYSLDAVDVIFLCFGHGKSEAFLREHAVPANVKIIDLAQDFRIAGQHDFVYGLPETHRETIRKANHLANPGCFATCIQLALLPALKAGILSGDIHVNGITGSTGAGQKPGPTTHYSWRNDNISVYKTFTHQHLLEINQTVHELQPGYDGRIFFIPQRGCFARGIYVTAYAKCDTPIETVLTIYQDYYGDAAFTHLVTASPDLKQVVNTNKALVYVERYEDQLLMISCIDNLLKGAVGQAVQNMNLMFGLDEKAGLNLKASAF